MCFGYVDCAGWSNALVTWHNAFVSDSFIAGVHDNHRESAGFVKPFFLDLSATRARKQEFVTLKATVSILVLIMMYPVAMAEPFSYEVAGSYEQLEADLPETDTLTLRGTYYWRPVNVNEAPFSEAAFADRASSVSLGLESVDRDFQPVFIAQSLNGAPVLDLAMLPDSPNLSGVPAAITPLSFSPALPPDDGDEIFSGSLRYVNQDGWIGGFSYARSVDESSLVTSFSTSRFERDFSNLSISIGKYVGAMTTLGFRFNDTRADSSTMRTPNAVTGTPVSVPPFLGGVLAVLSSSSSDTATKGYTLSTKSLFTWNNYQHSIGVSVGYDVTDLESRLVFEGSTTPSTPFNDSTYGLRTGIDYVFYPRQHVGLGVAYSVRDGEFSEDKALSLSVDWFVTPKVAVEIRYLSTDSPGPFNDADGFGLGVRGRF